MKITLLLPTEGETLSLLQQKHLDYIKHPRNDPTSKVDWLNLRETEEDLSYPQPVRFTFSPTVDGTVYLRHLNGQVQALAAANGEATTENLLLDADYEWWVQIVNDRSAIRSFRTAAQPPRFLRVEGISNVRDFGGFWTNSGKRVAQSRIFRTSEMDTHVTITANGIHTLEDELGIRTDLDLRGIKDEPRCPVLNEQKVKWINIPLAAYEAIYTPEQMARYGDSYRLLTDDVYPLMVHCWGGIDRTGCWLYILGAMLGVSKDDLDLDYEMSSFSRWSRRSRYSEQFQTFLQGLYRYGNTLQAAAQNFMIACGLNETELEQIAKNLLENG